MFFFDIGHAFLLRMDPERAHRLFLSMMRMGIYPRAQIQDHPLLRVSVCGLEFQNPLGCAAGLDKDALVPDVLGKMGFGFVEVGTLTPQPQQGSPLPRLFRLTKDKAIINRMGFCNQGYLAALGRLRESKKPGILGINLGANKESQDRIADYVHGVRLFSGIADYFTINISSPNTPGLRDLQMRDMLDLLLLSILKERDNASARTPVFLKISPDLRGDNLKDVVEISMKRRIDGMIVSNTTISRPSLLQEKLLAREAGGLSGVPLFFLSTRLLAEVFLLSGGEIPLIGVGGISDVETTYQKIRAGASLLQIYSALIYSGSNILEEIKMGLVKKIQSEGVSSIQELVGRGASEWSEMEIPA